MIKVLLMDDTPEKIEKIKKVLTTNCLLSDDNITVAKSINSGRTELAKNQYDILILDLVMPLDDDQPIEEGGQSEKFVDEMKRIGRLKMPHYIIGLSQYQQKVDENADKFNRKIWKLIHYDLQQDDWIDLLQEAVDSIIITKKQLVESIKRESSFDIGILCALPEELEQLVKAFNVKWTDFSIPNCSFLFKKTEFRSELGHTLRIVVTCGQLPGMQASATISSFMMSTFDLKYMFMTGFCAGFKKDGVNYGDVFIASSEYDYGAGKLVKQGDEQLKLPEPTQYPCSYDLLTKLQTYISSQKPEIQIFSMVKDKNLDYNGMTVPNIYVAPGACGSYVVDDQDFMNTLLADDNRKLRGLEMEGYGLYMAGHILRKECLMVKGIADFADGKKDDKYHKLGSFASALFLKNFIMYTL